MISVVDQAFVIEVKDVLLLMDIKEEFPKFSEDLKNLVKKCGAF